MKQIHRIIILSLFALIGVAQATWAQYITDVILIGSGKSIDRVADEYVAKGWTHTNCDLNAETREGATSIYLLYKKGSNKADAVTDFYVKIAGKSSHPETIDHNGHTYIQVPGGYDDNFIKYHCDLNQNASGDYIYLYYTKDAFDDGRAVTNIQFSQISEGAVSANGGYDAANLNSGAGGDKIYMHITLNLSTPWTGAGTEANPYLINNVNDWKALASNINTGLNTYKGKSFKLMSDITLSESISSGDPATMVGVSDDRSFQGKFNGNGHTITLDYNDTRNADFCAPFRFINGATIKYLHVAGTIYKTQGKYAGGIVGHAKGSNLIYNCRSSVDINFNKSGDTSSGGVIGELRNGGTTIFSDCVFNGQLRGQKASNWGGFIGWIASNCKAEFYNSLFNPTATSISSSSNKTFARYADGCKPLLDNCLATLMLSKDQGSDVSARDKDEICILLGEQWEVSGNSVQPYMGIHSFSGGDGSEASPYLITNRTDWESLAINVILGQTYRGKFFKMTNDITISEPNDKHFLMVGPLLNEANQTTDRMFQGTFDGDGHKLRYDLHGYDIDRRTTTAFNEPYCAPFRMIWCATIKNLHVAGTINTAKEYAASLVGYAFGGNYIENCVSTVDIRSSFNGDAYNGGFVAHVYKGETYIDGCRFNGSLIGDNCRKCGGFVGNASIDAPNEPEIFVTNSLLDPTDVSLSYSGENAGGHNNFVQGNSKFITLNKCYYLSPIISSTSNRLRRITSVEGINVSPVGEATVYDVSRIKTYDTGIMIDGKDVLYAGPGEDVNLNLSIADGYNFEGSFVADNGFISGAENPYTLTMNWRSGDVTINNIQGDVDWETLASGTKDDPYMINSSYQLNLLASRVNAGNSYKGKFFKLGADISYQSSYAVGNNAAKENNFRSIGYWEYCDFKHEDYDYEDEAPFAGSFDGNGHTISGVRVYKELATKLERWEEIQEEHIDHFEHPSGHTDIPDYWEEIIEYEVTREENREVIDAYGIFGYVTGEVKNLIIDDVNISGPKMVGGIVGRLKGTVSNCHATEQVAINQTSNTLESEVQVGGIVGYSDEGSIYDCTSSVDMSRVNDKSTKGDFGGIVGYAQKGTVSGNFAISASIALSDLNSKQRTHGAVAGTVSGTTLKNNFYFDCTLKGSMDPASGIANSDYYDHKGAVPGICLYDNPAMRDLNTKIIQKGSTSTLSSFLLQGRTLSKNGDWNTICLPFYLRARQIEQSPLAGAIIKELDTSANGTNLNDDGLLTLKFKDATSIECGKPYIIRWEGTSGTIESPEIGILNADISDTPGTVTSFDGKVSFVGQYDPFTINRYNKDEILFVGSGNKIGYVAPDATLPRPLKAFRAHFEITPDGFGSNHARTIRIDWGDGEATGIEQLSIVNDQWSMDNGQSESWYTIDGRRLNGKPSRSGIYINNGNKIVIE